MKKLIAILAVFAFMTAALFAQEGSWSVGGSGRIGASINFKPVEDTFSSADGNVSHAGIWADGWDQSADNVKGSLGITYNKGGLSTGFDVDQNGGFTVRLTFNGENWQFSAAKNARKLLDPAGTNDTARDTLWGNYTFQVLNGVKLEASVSRTGQQWWNVTDIFGDTLTHTKWGNNDGRNVGTGLGIGDGLNSASYLLLDASPMAGLNLGFVIPNMFVYDKESSPVDLQEEALRYTVFGGKFASGPIQVGLQFALRGQQDPFVDKDGKVTNTREDLRSALYISGQYTINGQMNAALEFRGLFGRQAIVSKDGDAVVPAGTPDAQYLDRADFGIGAQFNYNDGPFGVNVRLRYRDENSAVAHVGDSFYFRVRPYYNLVDGFLRFQLTTEFTFKDAVEKVEDGKNVWAGVMDYVIQPELYFNFLGNGAGSWGTGFAARYRITGPAGYFEPNKGHNTNNFMELVFNWSF